ncbi:peptidoglycan-binding protein [Evansella cellulosilytica]|uniref:NLP/P60 protein n=1 Tax=Evansella cellulosilytica (strain ATCC 21833 / DSM 2522 / FERM P-1141 / JCM 9156 / N-4) TaxID=649639 RepID=E6U262_EVAC2|nr:peptidoglycan-binding protein [Evansella cellulosilytica]ADU30440.1 NLP/P60 protein [Evansella cellulosilytica DSM 2522]
MSRFRLRDHKGTILFSSVVAGAALAPIITSMPNESNVEHDEKLVAFPQPLSSSAQIDVQSPYAQSLPVFQHSNTLNNNLFDQSKNQNFLTTSSLAERTSAVKAKNVPTEKSLRLIINQLANEEFEIKTDTNKNVWPVDTVLSIGDHGPKVKIIQEHLSEIGYYVQEIDGLYGEKTEKAVERYQKEHGLNITGKVDHETIIYLVGIKQIVTRDISDEETGEDLNTIYYPNQDDNENKVYTKATTHGMKDDDDITPSYFQYGDEHEDIKELQELLNKAGYYNGTIDGIYGSNTQQAVRMLQRDNDLMVDGLAGDQVFDFLKSSDLKKIADNLEKSQVESTKNENNSKETIEKSSNSMENIIARGEQLIGTPYLWGGTSPSGFDCSGFLLYVFKQEGLSLPRSIVDIWNASSSVSEPSRGDLVFFETYKKGPSHAGIYLGNGAFLHTGTSTGVTISHLDESYWKNRYLGAKRF